MAAALLACSAQGICTVQVRTAPTLVRPENAATTAHPGASIVFASCGGSIAHRFKYLLLATWHLDYMAATTDDVAGDVGGRSADKLPVAEALAQMQALVQQGKIAEVRWCWCTDRCHLTCAALHVSHDNVPCVHPTHGTGS